ncbi:hypothetical protein [Brucella intermedia]|uniref:hypothetical protein n=1 Tax=Brucella intermedia TaxID=94625 RepID=UPI00224A8E07|nr:hypothetical protein [Brucella intermedia]
MAKESAEYSIGGESTGISISMGGDGTGEEVSHAPVKNIEFDTSDLPDVNDDEDIEGDTSTDTQSDDGENTDDGQEDDGEELGSFDPDDPDVVAKYESRYVKNGEIDADGALSAEFFANAEKGVEGLNEETYKFLESKGISKATVKRIEAMAATERDAQTNSVQAQDFKLFDLAGGSDQLQTALQWGKAGGYSEAQQKRFNDILKGSDYEAKAEAVEALMSRYNKANPKKRPEVPARDATKGQAKTTQGVKGFESREEARKFRNGLRDTDTRGWEAYRKRLAASKFE